MRPSFLVVGAGFSGAVVARSLAEKIDCTVDVFDERDHVAGNCHTSRDTSTGVMVHRYGPHIFNTNDERVWRYVQKFGQFNPFINRVKAVTRRGVFSLPINLHTLNQFFGRSMGPAEARAFVGQLGDKSITAPANFEEQALRILGKDLYETFLKGYTIKQWGCPPSELPASLLKRLPMRFNYDDNYYDKHFQGIPRDGYTAIVNAMLDHPRIVVVLGCKFVPDKHARPESEYRHIFYTGPIDAFFGHRLGRLGYRTVEFERIETTEADYQGNAVLNYPETDVPWTRIHEHKHFAPWEKFDRTVAFREFSKETGPGDIPYYPKRLAADKQLLSEYRSLAEREAATRRPSVSFLGRLATYRYMDMEAVIGEALTFMGTVVASLQDGHVVPTFPNTEPA